MGCYDTIYFNCADCGEEICAQSKSGDCCLGEYPSREVPVEVAKDANRHSPFECPNCGAYWEFEGVRPSEHVSLIIKRA